MARDLTSRRKAESWLFLKAAIVSFPVPLNDLLREKCVLLVPVTSGSVKSRTLILWRIMVPSRLAMRASLNSKL